MFTLSIFLIPGYFLICYIPPVSILGQFLKDEMILFLEKTKVIIINI